MRQVLDVQNAAELLKKHYQCVYGLSTICCCCISLVKHLALVMFSSIVRTCTMLPVNITIEPLVVSFFYVYPDGHDS